jgi:ubiquinone biosynthesis protein
VIPSVAVLKEAFQDLNRLRQIAVVVARHGFGAYLDSTRLPKREAEVLREAAREGQPAPAAEPDRRTAARFRQLLVDLGPTFIKLGQLLSSRPDILPSHWIEELSELQDAVPPVPLRQVRREIERGLGRPIDELFASLDDEPLASASIAQVHRARTHDGRSVVVKVQRPGTRERIEGDLPLLYYLAWLLEAAIEETGVYTPTGIIEEFDRSIREELDFQNEARNVRAMAEASRDLAFLVIPAVHDDLSSATVLALDYLDGLKVSDVTAESGHDLELVARRIIEAAFRQLFEKGIFHGDPHPGNVLVLAENRIGLIDFGLVGRLSRPMQDVLVLLVIAVALRDPGTLARLLNKVGIPDQHAPIAAFRADIQSILDRYLGLTLDEIRATSLLRDLLDLALRHKIKVPKEYAVLSKAAVAVEGIIRRLYPKLDILEVGLPYARELLVSRLTPGDAGGAVMKSLLSLQTLAQDVPAQLAQILLDVEGGKLRVNVHSEQLDRIAGNVRAAGLTVFLGIGAASFTIGGFMLLVNAAAGWSGMAWAGVAALIFASALVGAALATQLASAPRRKISLRRWFPGARPAPTRQEEHR